MVPEGLRGHAPGGFQWRLRLPPGDLFHARTSMLGASAGHAIRASRENGRSAAYTGRKARDPRTPCSPEAGRTDRMRLLISMDWLSHTGTRLRPRSKPVARSIAEIERGVKNRTCVGSSRFH